MESITVGQIFGWVSAIAGGVGAIILIVQWIRKILLNVVKEPIEKLSADVKMLQKEMNERIDETNQSIENVNMNYCKSFITQTLGAVARGDALTEAERIRFKEEYDYYISAGHNSYIKDWYETLHAKELI